jgi:Xaa-Pro aminopeptidase
MRFPSFAGFHHWEPDALPGERRLAEGEAFILDAAPLVDGHPADYAYSGALGPSAEQLEMRRALAALKSRIVELARTATTGAELFEATGAAVREAGFEVVHHLYPAAVLGHRFDGLPRWLGERPQGVFAIEPHLARGDCGAKFESVLVVDGDETRWLDPGLFGDVEG